MNITNLHILILSACAAAVTFTPRIAKQFYKKRKAYLTSISELRSLAWQIGIPIFSSHTIGFNALIVDNSHIEIGYPLLNQLSAKMLEAVVWHEAGHHHYQRRTFGAGPSGACP